MQSGGALGDAHPGQLVPTSARLATSSSPSNWAVQQGELLSQMSIGGGQGELDEGGATGQFGRGLASGGVNLIGLAGAQNASNFAPTLSNLSAAGQLQASLEPQASNGQGHLFVVLFVSLILINLIVILGNILVIVAVYGSAKLRNVTNIFIVSLATADLLLGLLVLPYALVYEVSVSLCFVRRCEDSWKRASGRARESKSVAGATSRRRS